MYFKIHMSTIVGFIACITHLTAEVDSSNLSPSQAHEQIQKDIHHQTQQAKDEVQKNLVPEAISIVEDTKRAINFIKSKQNAEALSALERATGKSDILLARHPRSALLPVDFIIRVSDVAPTDLNEINGIEMLIKRAINHKNYPSSRALLNLLRSEIHVTIDCLPLAYYPEVLKEAARLLELNQPSEACLALETALNTLVVLDQIFPIPLIKAIALLNAAEGNLEKERNKENALKLVNKAHFELRRSIELGYLEKNSEEHRSLNEKFADLENKIKSDQKATSVFQSLKDKFRDFLRFFSKPKSAY
ncbi:YfdX family protein [Parachlamydia sp. AcF125]|uniref:YfdX family protein n=1 Tax=Parachlamydia sp. AcF125 TaxID=2795736 RepID=UPI001BC9E90F|nr:YfdX family protein [Parachlamydia sp. AcF125]MBS4168177.1 hypothetical protein [Parachlamydia sp. AcF125]